MEKFLNHILEEIPKPPSDPAPTAKESQLIEDEAPWRRPTSIRLNRSNQLENPPKIRNYLICIDDYTEHSSVIIMFCCLIHFPNTILAEVPEKESTNTLDSEVMLRRTQSFENDEK